MKTSKRRVGQALAKALCDYSDAFPGHWTDPKTARDLNDLLCDIQRREPYGSLKGTLDARVMKLRHELLGVVRKVTP